MNLKKIGMNCMTRYKMSMKKMRMNHMTEDKISMKKMRMNHMTRDKMSMKKIRMKVVHPLIGTTLDVSQVILLLLVLLLELDIVYTNMGVHCLIPSHHLMQYQLNYLKVLVLLFPLRKLLFLNLRSILETRTYLEEHIQHQRYLKPFRLQNVFNVMIQLNLLISLSTSYL